MAARLFLAPPFEMQPTIRVFPAKAKSFFIQESGGAPVSGFGFGGQSGTSLLRIGDEHRRHAPPPICVSGNKIEDFVRVEPHHACNLAVDFDHPKLPSAAFFPHPLNTIRKNKRVAKRDIIARRP